MKKLLVILFSLGITLGATAQPKIGSGFRGSGVRGSGHSGGVHYVRPRVTVIAPYASMYPYYGYGLGFGYLPFNDPFYRQRVEAPPSQLDLQIEDIKNDYDYQISSVKHDKTLSKDERKQKVRDLKHQKDQEIIDAKKSYYKPKDDNKDSE
ncbi:MAG: hypothetical protein JWQ09_13 [Segetibacter sp.]|nr:hypothetical protein [Segetibacter sp.]